MSHVIHHTSHIAPPRSGKVCNQILPHVHNPSHTLCINFLCTYIHTSYIIFHTSYITHHTSYTIIHHTHHTSRTQRNTIYVTLQLQNQIARCLTQKYGVSNPKKAPGLQSAIKIPHLSNVWMMRVRVKQANVRQGTCVWCMMCVMYDVWM